MLTQIKLTNFKSHKETELGLKNLTLLTGPNGVGKSSTIQAILLLRQSYLKQRIHEGLDLNGNLCSLGKVEDVFYFYAESGEIQIAFVDNGNNYEWKFSTSNLLDTFMGITGTTVGPIKNMSESIIFSNNFQYLSADRVSSQESYPKDTYAVEKQHQISIEKGRGELVAHFLNHFGFPSDKNNNKRVLETLLHANNKNTSLLPQVDAWMREISSDINVQVEGGDKNFQIKYSFDRPGDLPTDQLRPENVGFGVSYTLSVVTAILAAESGSLLLIENPEAHIHPRGQAKLAELIALAAQSGIQLIIETHSDHIVNGILVACKKFEEGEKGIDRNLVSLYYMDRVREEHATTAIAIPILEQGNIHNPPKGFFDQFEIDMENLMDF